MATFPRRHPPLTPTAPLACAILPFPTPKEVAQAARRSATARRGSRRCDYVPGFFLSSCLSVCLPLTHALPKGVPRSILSFFVVGLFLSCLSAPLSRKFQRFHGRSCVPVREENRRDVCTRAACEAFVSRPQQHRSFSFLSFHTEFHPRGPNLQQTPKPKSFRSFVMTAQSRQKFSKQKKEEKRNTKVSEVFDAHGVHIWGQRTC